jgi:hypothetical protein
MPNFSVVMAGPTCRNQQLSEGSRVVESESEGILGGIGVGVGKNVPTPTPTSI